MKITKEHIGKKLIRKGCSGPATVTGIGSSYFLYSYNNDVEYSDHCHQNTWELYQEPFIVEGREVKPGDKLALAREGGAALCAYVTVKEVINANSFKSDNDIVWYLGSDWKFYQEKKLYAPALIKKIGAFKDWVALSHSLYSSEIEAKIEFEESFLKWPAIPNAQGFYEV